MMTHRAVLLRQRICGVEILLVDNSRERTKLNEHRLAVLENVAECISRAVPVFQREIRSRGMSLHGKILITMFLVWI